jgi:hypothetical protein
MLESSLSYELGILLKIAFIHLEELSQEKITKNILSIWSENNEDQMSRLRILKKRSELIIAIPCHLRSLEAQAILDAYEESNGKLIREPDIMFSSGTVLAPFSFEVFLNSSDQGIINLLNHYSECTRGFDNSFIGGKQEVGWQLSEAALRHPMRFLLFLKTYWNDIPKDFHNEIMKGISNYLAHRYGNLHLNKEAEIVETPYAPELAKNILDELERHSTHWHHNRFASDALKACSHVIRDSNDAERLVFISIDFLTNTDELLTTGINMVSEITESLMILANRFLEINVPFPTLLTPTLQRFAGHARPEIRALVLQHLPYLQSKKPKLGWDLFQRAMQNSTGLWKISESCLYYSYRNNFETVAPILDRIKHEGNHSDMETLGRISALAALSNLIDFPNLSDNLKVWDVTEAWMGAVNVWVNPNNASRFQDQCFSGIEIALEASRHPQRVAQMSEKLFRNNQPIISVPIKLIQKIFTTLEKDNEGKNHHFYGFSEWLNLISQRDPDLAIAATEIYLAYVKRTKPYFDDHNNNLSQLITRLFAEAEEREESDGGVMLQSVVLIQDTLLSLGVSSINDWLKAAERP